MNTGMALISNDNWDDLKITLPVVAELLEESPNDTSQIMNILVLQMLSIHEAKVAADNQLKEKDRYIEGLQQTIARFKNVIKEQGHSITTAQKNEVFLKNEVTEAQKKRNKPVKNSYLFYGYLTTCMVIYAIFFAIYKNEHKLI